LGTAILVFWDFAFCRLKVHGLIYPVSKSLTDFCSFCFGLCFEVFAESHGDHLNLLARQSLCGIAIGILFESHTQSVANELVSRSGIDSRPNNATCGEVLWGHAGLGKREKIKNAKLVANKQQLQQKQKQVQLTTKMLAAKL